MPDWIGGDGHTTSETYRWMAETQLRGVSPTYEQLCLAIAMSPDVCALLDRVPPAKRQPNLLLAAVRWLDGPLDPDGFCAFLRERWNDVEPILLTRFTQTNESGRCATLLPQLAVIAGPVALLEVGASAGLCLYPDRYGYDYSGHHVGTGQPRLACGWEGGAVPDVLPDVLPDVVWRAGLDLNPLDVTDTGDVGWLEALIWPEQIHRFETLRRAVAVARADPPLLVAGDLTTDVPGLAERAPADATLVIFHSAVLAYLPPTARERFYAQVRDTAARRPTVWLSNEAAGVVPGTDIDTPDHSFVVARDGVPVGLAAPHGQWYRALA